MSGDMGTLFIVVLVCLPAACIVGVLVGARFGYNRVKAGFNIGRSGFSIEADDLARQSSSASSVSEPRAPAPPRLHLTGGASPRSPSAERPEPRRKGLREIW